jgi:hypothetical protein
MALNRLSSSTADSLASGWQRGRFLLLTSVILFAFDKQLYNVIYNMENNNWLTELGYIAEHRLLNSID